MARGRRRPQETDASIPDAAKSVLATWGVRVVVCGGDVGGSEGGVLNVKPLLQRLRATSSNAARPYWAEERAEGGGGKNTNISANFKALKITLRNPEDLPPVLFYPGQRH